MSDAKYIRSSYDQLNNQHHPQDVYDNYNHVIIDLKREMSRSRPELSNEGLAEPQVTVQVLEETVRQSRRTSLKTFEWLNGKVDQLRRRFSAAAAAASNHPPVVKKERSQNAQTRKREDISPIEPKKTFKAARTTASPTAAKSCNASIDEDIMILCENYRSCAGNKYTRVVEPFDSILARFARLIRENELILQRSSDMDPPCGVLLLPLSDATNQTLLDFREMGGFSIGRGSRAVKRADQSLSRSHCLIYLEGEGGGLIIKDCDSQSGTFVDGKLLGSSQPSQLKNFDIIQLGYGENSSKDSVQFLVLFLLEWEANQSMTLAGQLASPTNSYAQHDAVMTMSKTFSSSKLNLPTFNAPAIEDAREVSKLPDLATRFEPSIGSMTNYPSPKLQAIKNVQQLKSLPTTPFKQAMESSPIAASHRHTNLSGDFQKVVVLTDLKDHGEEPSKISKGLKKNLSKSIEDIFSEQLELFPQKPETLQKCEKLPRKRSVAQVVNYEVPEFLKKLDCKVPATSPFLEALNSVPASRASKHDILTQDKRAKRLKGLRDGTRFSTLVCGSDTIRMETFVDFGTGASDISDGLAEGYLANGNGGPRLRWAFHNYRCTWQIEGINSTTGNKINLRALGAQNNVYELEIGGKGRNEEAVKIATISLKLPRKGTSQPQGQVQFSLDDEAIKVLGLLENQREDALPIKALSQLAYFYPHLQMPSLTIQGTPEAEGRGEGAKVFLRESRIAQLNLESHKISWDRRSLAWSLDIDSDKVPNDSLLSDCLQSVMLLYCLRYHVD